MARYHKYDIAMSLTFMELCNSDWYWRAPHHQASDLKPTSFDTTQMSLPPPPCEKVCKVPGCKDDGEDKQHWGKPMSQQKSARSPVVFAWAAIHQVLKLLGNLFLYPFSHVVERWPGRPVGEGNGVSACFLRGTGLIFCGGKQKGSEETRSGLKSPTFCWFRSAICSS